MILQMNVATLYSIGLWQYSTLSLAHKLAHVRCRHD